VTVLATAPPVELIALDDAEPWADLRRHPVWVAVTTGTAPPQLVRDLVAALYPVFTGRARYLLAAKVSFLDLEDGKAVFEELHRALTIADADADAGFEALARALGLSDDDRELARNHPVAVAEDLVTVVRQHAHRSAHEGIGTALVLDRRLPALLGDLAGALAEHYSVAAEALAHLRYRAAESAAAESRVACLAEKYLRDPFEVFEARRAAREVIWDLTALLEVVAES
jgi:hypothetical protein